MNLGTLIAIGAGAGVSGYVLGKRFLKRNKLKSFNLRGVGCSLKGLGPCRPIGKELGQAGAKTAFAALMREMGASIRGGRCGEARRHLLRATSTARTNKEKSSLLKAFRKLQRCEISQISQD